MQSLLHGWRIKVSKSFDTFGSITTIAAAFDGTRCMFKTPFCPTLSLMASVLVWSNAVKHWRRVLPVFVNLFNYVTSNFASTPAPLDCQLLNGKHFFHFLPFSCETWLHLYDLMLCSGTCNPNGCSSHVCDSMNINISLFWDLYLVTKGTVFAILLIWSYGFCTIFVSCSTESFALLTLAYYWAVQW